MLKHRVELRKAAGNYAAVNGLDMYYEVHGEGRPLVLLHGAMSTSEVDFGKVLPALAENRKVIAIEQQAHGHTADIDRRLTYEQMADDTAALLRYLNIENADFLGYSMGGAVAFQVALQYPELVGKFVFAGGTSYRPEGLYPELLEGIKELKPEAMAGTPFEQAYTKVAPYPENWPKLVAKVRELDLTFEGWPDEAVRGLKAPVLLMIGDSDIVRPEHTMEMFRLLGGGVIGDVAGVPKSQLAVLPGTTHITLVDQVDWLVTMVSRFLDASGVVETDSAS